MALRGNLRDFTITQLLNLVNLAQKTGTLVVDGPSEQAYISFRDGKLAYARVGHDDGSLAAVLHKANKLTVNQYRAIVERAGKISDKELGLLLINAVERFTDPTEPLHNELLTGISLCTGYIIFDTTRPPFDDVNVRKAFSEAFNRQKYIDVVLDGHALPANGLYPPVLPGFNLALKGLPYDPAQARQLLAQSKYGGPNGLPPIVFSNIGIGSYISPDVAALAEMWEQNLGVSITVENLEPNYYYDQVYADHHGQLFSGGWCADYPDPENFADVLFHTGSPQNNGGYSNPQLDALLEAARVEQDVRKRIGMYQQAEQIIVNDAAALFTTYSLSYQLVKPYVKGYVFTPIDIPIERYMWLDGK